MPLVCALVKKLGIRLKQLRVPVAFCQLDGSVAGRSQQRTSPWSHRGGTYLDSELYSGPWHGETGARTSVAAEIELLCELEEGAVKKYDGQAQGKIRGGTRGSRNPDRRWELHPRNRRRQT